MMEMATRVFKGAADLAQQKKKELPHGSCSGLTLAAHSDST